MHPEVLDRIGSTSHYEDAALYDATYADRVVDIAAYVALCEVGPVLEYGCGSGRITAPLWRRGLQLVGVDRSEAMLAALTRRAPGVVPVRGDLRTARVRGRFPRILCTFNTILHLYTTRDLRSFFRRVRRQLTDDGIFAFDALVPSLRDLAREGPRRGRSVQLPDGHRYSYVETFGYEPLEQILYVTMDWTPIGEGAPRRVILAHRQIFPAELAGLLETSGLEVVRVVGDFDPEVDPRDADSLLWVCRRA